MPHSFGCFFSLLWGITLLLPILVRPITGKFLGGKVIFEITHIFGLQTWKIDSFIAQLQLQVSIRVCISIIAKGK
jgi:hypothetical protein